MLVYLASPYSAKMAEQRHDRFIQICKVAAKLMEQGYQVFCPIAHSHSIDVNGMSQMRDGEFWLKQDFAILKHCDALFVCKMEGWDKSYGVNEESKFARRNHIPVSYLDADGNLQYDAKYSPLLEKQNGTTRQAV